MSEELDKGYKKIGKFSIFCGIWNAITGFLFCFAFVFSSFDMGEEGYAKVGQLYKQIAANIDWLSTFLSIVGLISCVFLIVGGIVSFLNKKNTRVCLFGLIGIYFYFFCIGLIAILLSASGGVIGTAFLWILSGLIILGPNFYLQWMLNKELR